MARRRAGGCGITSFLGFLILIVLILIGVVGYLYLKDSNWFQNRRHQLQQKAGQFKVLQKKGRDLYEEGADLYKKATAPEVRSNARHALKEVEKTAAVLKQKATNVSRILKEEEPQTVTSVKKQAIKTESKQNAAKKKVLPEKKSVKTTETVKNVNPVLTAKKEITSDTTKIYLIRYSETDGSIKLVPAIRPRPKGDSPLYDTLKALVAGPDDKEDSVGLSTAIPGGVSLNSLKVQDGTAFIDVSGNFENGTGGKIMKSRVYQIVYTATEFPTVNNVLITIDGRKVTNFGGEGIDLTKPLGRLSGMPKF
jgi:spore germination protein GerM